LQKEQADLAQAIFDSKFEPPNAGVFRLTRGHDDPEVRKALMTAEALGDCRMRVAEAGCELYPAWGNGALFLLPFREQSKELQLQGIRLEDLKPYNIVAFLDDEVRVNEALAQVPRRRRPQCKHEGAGSASSSAISASTIPGASSGEILETGMESDPATELLSDIRIEIVRTFVTVVTSGESGSCHSAPGPW